MIITETFCDKAFKDIRFNKKNMESALSLIKTNWVSDSFNNLGLLRHLFY